METARKDAGECSVCKSSCKEVEKCKQFLELSRESRWAVVHDLNLCRRCLDKHNGSCKAKVCGKNGCTRKHHELLHNENQKEKAANPKSDEQQGGETAMNSTRHECNSHRSGSSSSLFRYLPVTLHGKSGSIQTFAFLDEGSKLTLMDKDLADELELEGDESPLYLRWTGGTERCEKDSRVTTVTIAGTHDGAKSFKLDEVRTVNDLQLPRQSLNIGKMSEQYPYLRGLPIESYKGARPRILIGLKHAHVSLVLQCREGKLEQPIAIKTRLGWTVCGGSDGENVPNMVHYSFHVGSRDGHLDEDLHQAMKDYFALDSMGVAKPNEVLLSSEDQRSCRMLESLTHLNGDRYETGLLWRYDDIRLPNSRQMALRRYNLLEKRMAKTPELAKALDQKIAEYITKGYIRRLSKEEEDRPASRVWYLPVFPVFNPNKPAKIRIVWDAAATIFGMSLNSALLKGPDQLCSLYSILLQFREHPIGLTGDIREMFHQIQIREQDRSCQRFFWRNERGETTVFEMCVMTFGACCSPSSAQFVKNLNAERFIGRYPEAVDVIIKRHYVDDMLVSVKTEKEAITLANQVKYVHSQGGFEIRNWISNSPAVMRSLGEDEAKIKNLDLSAEMATEKVLGLWWCTEKDTLTYKVGWTRYDEVLLEEQRRPTKREVLRVLMSIFDPLGLIAHFLIYLKVLLQEIWRSGAQWDEKINDNLFLKWQTWLQVLPDVEGVQIPRCYHTRNPAACEIQLHTFVDASENGFAAVSYMRFSNGDEVECTLITAKTRVAPLKYLSIPRLELQAAVLGARLAQTISESLSIRATQRYFWTDSRDVLCWINSDHRRFSQFVAHRVSELLDTTEASEWRWIPTKENVADDATKWQGRPDLTVNSRWFNGPHFLLKSEAYWPRQTQFNTSTLEELRPHVLAHIPTEMPVLRVTDYSNWRRLVTVIGFVLRFPDNCRRKLQHHPSRTGSLCTEEIRTAEECIIRQAQQDAFSEEINALMQSKRIARSSSLFKLTPFIDESGMLRMRGRTTICPFIAEEAKNPIILPRDHHTTTLIVRKYHDKYHHLNQETVVNELRQRFSISRLRTVCAKVRRNCQRCKNDRVVPSAPIMADLPEARLAVYSRPFTHVGIDYFGPMEVAIGRRVEKRWGMLATCMTTRAVHIEVAHSLSTDSCVMAIRNMIARRGIPRYIYCDRGTNFVGTSRELSRVEKELDHEAMMREFARSEIAWSFNPPLSPHMGGCWERLIRSVKNSLKSLNLPRRPSDEILRNALTEIENTLNSRPLTHIPIDDDAAPALTPNHILLGHSSGAKPLTTLDDSFTIVRQCWRTSQVIANQFWRRWIAEYLPEITRRTKWYVSSASPIKMGDIVVIVDSTFPRSVAGDVGEKNRTDSYSRHIIGLVSYSKDVDWRLREAGCQASCIGRFTRRDVDDQVDLPGGVLANPLLPALTYHTATLNHTYVSVHRYDR
ncbi:uncharacterized protein LOC134290992 [Aedes albopictus]|uniref:Integrase catalytic domain-containing protein n=1 Tax=Aedes albopictus TaxID=7160 RepID=A0ABM2A3U7_AEDAL